MSLPARLLDRPIAHRGLWTVGGRPENSLAAFRAAVDAGYGIELDVQLSADGHAVVFHDETLERMTREAGIVEERTVDELARCRLLGGDEAIPTLAQALAVIAGAVPVLVELKTPVGQEGAIEEAAADLLRNYRGLYAVISFNSHSLACFAKRIPHAHRGLDLETPSRAHELDGLWRRKLTDLEHVEAADPAFILPRLELVADAGLQALRRKGMPLIPWTVRRPVEWEGARAYADNYLFEDFRP